MIKQILTITLITIAWLNAGAQLTFKGADQKPVSEKPDKNTGLDYVYVVYDTKDVTASYQSQSGQAVKFQRFSNLGAAYAEDIPSTADGTTYTVVLGSDDMGYVVEDGTDRHYYWVVNYANHQCHLQALEFAQEQECDRARLELTGDADHITYYTITGASRELSRNLVITYNTLVYDEDTDVYVQTQATQTIASIEHTFGVPSPLCDTHFTLTGDRFLEAWNMAESVESGNFSAIAVEAHTKAEQEMRENDNEQKVDAGTLGGSAPVDIAFTAAVTDAAIFREWQLAKDTEFEDILDRFQQLELNYTFRDNGNYFVRFVAANADGSCEYFSETYEVFVGESALLCPNVFSPNGDGVNDEWKVSYKSIVEFECHIFNRWGQEMCAFTDPSRGWDGRYGGKYVPTGVYYYVIRALGSDGRKYKLSGDINIIKSKNNITGSGSESTETTE